MNIHEFSPTDEQVERLARSFFARSKEGRDGFSWPLNGDWSRQRDLEDARRTLAYVITGEWPKYNTPQYQEGGSATTDHRLVALPDQHTTKEK